MPKAQVGNVSVYDFGAPSGPKLGTAATATITLATAVDGNTVTLGDGTTTVIFELDDDVSVTGTNVLVDLGANDDAAAANLAAAINASALRMTAVSATNVVTVTAVTDEGNEVSGNSYTIAKVGVPVTVTAFTGGIDQADGARVLEFRVRSGFGGHLMLNFESSNSVATYEVTAQVARTRSTPVQSNTYSNTTVANNKQAVVNLSVLPRTEQHARIYLRPGIDQFVSVVASGGARGVVTVRGDETLDIIKI